MFDDESVAYATLIAYAFGDDTPPDIGDELQALGATVSRGSCSACDGTLYDYKHEVICGNCSMVIGADNSPRTDTDAWQAFADNRDEYYHSDHYRCVGGYPHVHDWVERDDIDHPVSELAPTDFY